MSMDARIAASMNAMNALDAPLYETIARERREDPGLAAVSEQV